MALVTARLTATDQDASSTINENNSDAWDMNNGRTNVAFFGPSANPQAVIFTFKIEGLQQGSILNDVRLNIKMINGPYNNGGTSRIYAAVENNLNTAPVGGTEPFVRGTRGRTIWDRLGRITQAVTAYGNRCGPTHSHPSGLAGYGANPRDPYAILVKAFSTDQTADTAGRTLPANSVQKTENLVSCLQPLVNDPGWNPVEQWVTFYLFSDRTTAGSTTTNVGNISTLTYNNGMVPSTSTVSIPSSAQVSQYHPSDAPTWSLLEIDYQSDDLSTSGSESGVGRASLMGKQLVVARWRGERFNADRHGVMPGDAGSGDIPFYNFTAHSTNMQNATWGDDGTQSLFNEGPKFFANPWLSKRRPDSQGIVFGDWLGRNANITWDVRKYNPWVTDDLHTYSARFYMAPTGAATPLGEVWNNWLTVRNSTPGDSWKLETSFEHSFDQTTPFRPAIHWSGSGGSSAGVLPQLSRLNVDNDYYRIEVQASEFASPKVVVRTYRNDSTTPLHTLTGNPPSVAASSFVFGDMTGSGAFDMRFIDMEIWPNYDLNGEFSEDATKAAPYIPKKWKFHEITPEGNKPLVELGTISSSTPERTVTINPQILDIAKNTGVIAGPGFTQSLMSYGTGSTRLLNLYVPNGTPPPGGWPLMVWAHGGFFIGGDRYMGQPDLAHNITALGCAFASISYNKSSITGGSYPAFDPNSEATGRYPSFLLQFKEATAHLKSVASTYNLNPNKVIASGVSAGAYIAMAAVASKGVTNDGYGRNLTLAGNVSSFGTPNIPDPSYLGGFFWCPPINMTGMMAYDPHAVNPVCYVLGFAPRMLAVSNLFLGRGGDAGVPNMAGTGADDLIRLNAANLPLHFGYCWGASDWLVPSNKDDRIPANQDQRKVLLQAISDAGPNLPVGFEFTEICIEDAIHETVGLHDMDWGIFDTWLKGVV